jgi:hypothetical protein
MIIIISPQFPPYDDGPEALQSLRLAKLFKANGHKVTVITEKLSEIQDQITVITKRRGKYQSGLKNLLSIMKWVVWAAIQIRKISRNKETLILSRCYPLYSHWVPLLLKRRKKLWFANWNDPAPPILHVPPYGLGSSARLRIIHRLQLYLIGRYANVHTFPSYRLLKYMSGYLKETMKNFVQIPHIGEFPLQYRHSNHQRLVLSHFGSVYYRNWEFLIEAFSLALTERPKMRTEVILKLVGWMPEETISYVANRDLSDVVFLGKSVSPSETLELMQDSDVLILLETIMDEGIYLPSKMGDYAISKKPIFAVSPPNGEISDMAKKFDNFYFASVASVIEIKNELLRIYEDWTRNNLSYSEALYDHFHPESVFGIYRNLIKQYKKSS